MQEEAEKRIEDEEREIKRIKEQLDSPFFKMKMRDTQNCRAEIAERKERVGVARKQWEKCEAEKGEELRRWKMETEVEIKVHEKEIAGRLRRIEACRAEIREIEEVQKGGGYEGQV